MVTAKGHVGKSVTLVYRQVFNPVAYENNMMNVFKVVTLCGDVVECETIDYIGDDRVQCATCSNMCANVVESE